MHLSHRNTRAQFPLMFLARKRRCASYSNCVYWGGASRGRPVHSAYSCHRTMKGAQEGVVLWCVEGESEGEGGRVSV